MRVRLRSSPVVVVPLALAALLVRADAGPPPAPPGAPGVDRAEADRYAIIVDNQSFRAITVYALLTGTRFRLGSVHSRQVARLPANCADFLGRETDFELRSVAQRYRLEGETIGDCGQEIEIIVLPIGLEFSRIRITRADGSGTNYGAVSPNRAPIVTTN
ncbi:MAG: hypothetical protein ACRELC_11545 [Gemmatimonadota bacterium]